ncbi:MAG: hypothetical protein KAR20_28965, partial [Candidatus Heimdallarchaeota archaeon]|nr:hypothetical protein [Candidatus Heimdallarchaeota archaeon]
MIGYNESNISISNFSSNYSSAGDYNVTLSINYTNGTVLNYLYNLTINETYFDPVWNNTALPADIYVVEEGFNDTINISEYVSSIDSTINLSTFDVINVTGNLTELNWSFNNTTGILNISPLVDVYGDYIVQFNISEYDGNWSLSDNVIVHVTNVNDPIAILSQIGNQSILEGEWITEIDLTTIFEDNDSILTYTVGSYNDSTNLTITVIGDTLNISAAAIPGLKGTETFNFNVTADDTEYDAVTDMFHVNVTYVDDFPIVADTSALSNISVKNATTYNDPTLINLSNYFSDVDNSSLEYGFIINDINDNLTISIMSGELLNITADADFIGLNSSNITVWAYDGN